MLNFLKYNPNARSLDALNNVRRVQFFLWYALILLITVYLTYKMVGATYMLISVEGVRWDYSKLAWLLYVLGVIAIFLQPRYGVYMTVAFALAGDYYITFWFPFELNFSSKQSLLYFNDSMKLSPLETFLIWTLISYALRLLMSSKWSWREKIYLGPLFWPIVGFTCFVVLGFLYGLSQGGDRQVALWEVRSIFYLAMIFVLASNLLEERGHIVAFMWCVFVALTYESIMGIYFLGKFEGFSIAGLDGLGAHSAAVHFNTIFALTALSMIYKVAWWKRIILVIACMPLGIIYLVMQRRASMLTLVIALAFSGAMLFKFYPKVFYFLAPTATVIGLVYVAAFWNSGSAIAMPAQAVKSVISSDASEADRSSNEYRDIENSNTHFTIQQNPIFGVGFGKKFLMPYPLPDISFFEWWEYITHNSIVWMWMKAGIGGFFFMCLMISKGLVIGGSLAWRMPKTEVGAIVLVMTLYIMMHFMFAYVDMSWEPQSMLYVGAAFGIINAAERIMNRPVKQPEKRWKWMDEPEPIPMLEEAPAVAAAD